MQEKSPIPSKNSEERFGAAKLTSVSELMTDEKARVAETVAQQMGITFLRTSEEGQDYTTKEGRTSSVPQGRVYVRIETLQLDLADYWRQVKVAVSRTQASQ